MISYLLVVEQHRTQIVIHALLKCQQENLYHEQNVTHIDRKSGSAGMPRPRSYAVFCLKKKTSRSCCTAPVATMTWPGRAPSSSPPASPIPIRHRGLKTSHAYWVASAAATLPTPATMTTRPPPSQIESRGPTLSARGILRTRPWASCSRAAITVTGRRSAITEHHEGCG